MGNKNLSGNGGEGGGEERQLRDLRLASPQVTRGQWPYRVASDRAMKMASDLTPATSSGLQMTF